MLLPLFIFILQCRDKLGQERIWRESLGGPMAMKDRRECCWRYNYVCSMRMDPRFQSREPERVFQPDSQRDQVLPSQRMENFLQVDAPLP